MKIKITKARALLLHNLTWRTTPLQLWASLSLINSIRQQVIKLSKMAQKRKPKGQLWKIQILLKLKHLIKFKFNKAKLNQLRIKKSRGKIIWRQTRSIQITTRRPLLGVVRISRLIRELPRRPMMTTTLLRSREGLEVGTRREIQPKTHPRLIKIITMMATLTPKNKTRTQNTSGTPTPRLFTWT